MGCQSVFEPTKLAVSCAWQSLKAAPKFKDEGGSASKHGMSMRRTLHDFFKFQVWAEFQRAAPAGLQRLEVLCGFETISGTSCPQLPAGHYPPSSSIILTLVVAHIRRRIYIIHVHVYRSIINRRPELLLRRNQLHATRGRTQSCRIVPVDSPLDSPASPL